MERKITTLLKRNYISPKLTTIYLQLEQGIAASSVTAIPGNESNPGTPGIVDWNEEVDYKEIFV